MQVGIARRSLLNDQYCGDQSAYWQNEDRTIGCVIDGTGHGQKAEIVAKKALQYVADHLDDPLPEIFNGCDRVLRDSRGAVMDIAVVEHHTGLLTFAGIGDVGAKIFRSHRMTSLHLPVQDGTLGRGARTVRLHSEPLDRGDVVVIHSDGVTKRIDLERYESGVFSDAQKLAESILADFGRNTDDSAVLVMKCEADFL